MSVGELAHRPSGTYSGEAEEHQARGQGKKWTVTATNTSTEKRQELHGERNGTCAPELTKNSGVSLVLFGRRGRATYTALGQSAQTWWLFFHLITAPDVVHTIGPQVALTY